MGIMRLGFVHARVTDLEKAANYYTKVLGLEEVARQNGRRYFKCWDEYDHHSVVLEEGGLGLVKMGFKVESEEDLSEVERKMEEFGVRVSRVSAGENLALGEGLRCEIPSGHVLELYHRSEQTGTRTGTLNPDPWPTEQAGIAPPRIDHLLIAAQDVRTTTNFFMKALDFRLSERVVTDLKTEELLGTWLFCTNTPHDIAIIKGPNAKLHHFAFWLDSWQDLLRAGDIMAKNNVAVDMGPTRHGITRGQTIYFFDPCGNRNEVFSGGYITYRDFPCITWTADQIGKAIFYIQQEVNERFRSVLT